MNKMILLIGLLSLLALPSVVKSQSANDFKPISENMEEKCTGSLALNNSVCTRNIYSSNIFQQANNGSLYPYYDLYQFRYDSISGKLIFDAKDTRVILDPYAKVSNNYYYLSTIPTIIKNQLLPNLLVQKAGIIKFQYNFFKLIGIQEVGFKISSNQSCKNNDAVYICGSQIIDFNDMRGNPIYNITQKQVTTSNGTQAVKTAILAGYNRTIVFNQTHIMIKSIYSGLNILDPTVTLSGTNATGNSGIWRARHGTDIAGNFWDNDLKVASCCGGEDFSYFMINTTNIIPIGATVQSATLSLDYDVDGDAPFAAFSCNQTSEQTVTANPQSAPKCTNIPFNMTTVGNPPAGRGNVNNVSYVINQSHLRHTDSNGDNLAQNISIKLVWNNAAGTITDGINDLGTNKEPFVSVTYRVSDNLIPQSQLQGDNNTGNALFIFNRSYGFSVRYNDSQSLPVVRGALNTVIFENNFTGIMKNYSLNYLFDNKRDVHQFYFNVTNKTLKKGKVQWRVYANDTVGNRGAGIKFTRTVDNVKPVMSVFSVQTTVVNPLVTVNITDNLQLHKCWYNLTLQSTPNTPIGANPSYFSCGTNPVLVGLSDGQSYSFWLSANDTSANVNLTRCSAGTTCRKNWTVALPSGGVVGGGGGGGGGYYPSLNALNVSCNIEVLIFNYFSRPNQGGRDIVCKNNAAEPLQGNLQLSNNLTNYVDSKFCDIDMAKCGQEVNLLSGQSGILSTKWHIPKDFTYVYGVVYIITSNKVSEIPVEISPGPGFIFVESIAKYAKVDEIYAFYGLIGTVFFVVVLIYVGIFV